MSTYARIVSGAVVEIFTPPAGVTLAECFVAPVAAQFVDVTTVSPAPQPNWTATESGSTWTFAAPVAPTLTLAQQAAAAMATGLTITLTGTMTLAATVFPSDPATQTKLAAVMTTVNATSSFPGGGSTYPMKDAVGSWHTFSLSQYKSVAAAIATYAASLDLIIDGNPLAVSALPTASAALTV